MDVPSVRTNQGIELDGRISLLMMQLPSGVDLPETAQVYILCSRAEWREALFAYNQDY